MTRAHFETSLSIYAFSLLVQPQSQKSSNHVNSISRQIVDALCNLKYLQSCEVECLHNAKTIIEGGSGLGTYYIVHICVEYQFTTSPKVSSVYYVAPWQSGQQ